MKRVKVHLFKKEKISHGNFFSCRASNQDVHTKTFEDWARTWLEVYKKGTVSENTYLLTYKNTVEKHLVPYFTDRLITEIRPIDIQKFFSEKKKYSQTMLNKMQMCLNGIFESAIDNGFCTVNPTKKAKCIGKRAKGKTVLSDQQIAALQKIAWDEQRFDVVFILETGVRRGELLGLRWDDFDIRKSSYSIRRSIADKKGGGISIESPKWESYRTNPLTGIAYAAIKAMPVVCDYVFPNKHGHAQSPNSWSQKLARFMKRTHEKFPDIPVVTAHELRHTYGTALRRHGVDVYSIQKLMGHKDIKVTTGTYIHNEFETLKRAIRAQTIQSVS